MKKKRVKCNRVYRKGGRSFINFCRLFLGTSTCVANCWKKKKKSAAVPISNAKLGKSCNLKCLKVMETQLNTSICNFLPQP